MSSPAIALATNAYVRGSQRRITTPEVQGLIPHVDSMRVADECVEVGNPTTQQRREVGKQGAGHGGSPTNAMGGMSDRSGFASSEPQLMTTSVFPKCTHPRLNRRRAS